MLSASKRALVATFAAAVMFAPSAQGAPAPALRAAAPHAILCMPGFHLKYVCYNGVCHYVCVRDGS